jgi:hypothetical protein
MAQARGDSPQPLGVAQAAAPGQQRLGAASPGQLRTYQPSLAQELVEEGRARSVSPQVGSGRGAMVQKLASRWRALVRRAARQLQLPASRPSPRF